MKDYEINTGESLLDISHTYDLVQEVAAQFNEPIWEEGKSPIELLEKSANSTDVLREQVTATKESTDVLRGQVETLKQMAESMRVQTELAVRKSKKADVKSWFAIVISIISALFTYIINQDVINSFFINLSRS